MNNNSLSLLASYGGDSSDEEVSGCRVSTKRMHKDGGESEDYPKKVCSRLPVPSMLMDTNSCEDSYLDDPSLHNGRVRSFKHERGNWATYVYIPFESNVGLEALVKAILASIPTIKLQVVDEFHISLTKTVVLRHHWIDLFIASVKEKIQYFSKFLIMFDSLHVYCNEERTRTFLGIRIKSGFVTLVSMVDILDNCLAEFKLPPFYKDPSFHLSILWCVGDYEKELNTILIQLNDLFMNCMSEYSDENWYILVNSLFCKSGNKQFQFNLL